MNKKVYALLWVIIIVIILLSTPTSCPSLGLGSGLSWDHTNKKTEGFYTYGESYKRYCSSCGDLPNRAAVGSCTNCGICLTPTGNEEAVPGDQYGPYFRDDCLHWDYGNRYEYYPYSSVFPIAYPHPIYSRYPEFPSYRSSIRQPWRWRKWQQYATA